MPPLNVMPGSVASLALSYHANADGTQPWTCQSTGNEGNRHIVCKAQRFIVEKLALSPLALLAAALPRLDKMGLSFSHAAGKICGRQPLRDQYPNSKCNLITASRTAPRVLKGADMFFVTQSCFHKQRRVGLQCTCCHASPDGLVSWVAKIKSYKFVRKYH